MRTKTTTTKATKASKAATSELLAAPIDFSAIAANALSLPASVPATAAILSNDLPARQRAHLRALSRVFYAGDTQAVHSGKAAKPLSAYIAGSHNSAGHQQTTLNERTSALGACILTAYGKTQYNPAAIGADLSKHTTLALRGHIALAADKSGYSLTDIGAGYARARIAENATAIAALGPYPTE